MSNSHLHFGFENEGGAPSGIKRYSAQVRRAMQAVTPESWTFHSHKIAPLLRPAIAETWSRGWNISNLPYIPRQQSTIHTTSLLAPLKTPHRLVVTVHDLVPLTHPETLTPRGVSWHRKMLIHAVNNANVIVVPTQATGNLLQAHFQVADLGTRIVVAGGAPSLPSPDGSNPDLVPPQEYVVFLGTIEPRKRIDALIRAVSILPDITLVVLGHEGWGQINVLALCEKFGLPAERFRHIRFADDQQVSNVLASALALVLPSDAEGFGLPLVEAMALGVPVIHSDDPALCEVASQAGKVITRSSSIEEFAEKISLAVQEVSEMSEHYRELGIARSADFTWENTAKRIWEIHRSL